MFSRSVSPTVVGASVYQLRDTFLFVVRQFVSKSIQILLDYLRLESKDLRVTSVNRDTHPVDVGASETLDVGKVQETCARSVYPIFGSQAPESF
jgi:hypothetical protein